ncbi:DUF1270 family protein [Staphylococcus simiae]|uniref:DUF1270 family protein n=1 Tax=Staphylococcus simiae TaxID=308354 RepID=UPI0005951CE9|nr:DUF1270 family protein [Staphylococcus simiae]PNZ12646.1 DUF1270 domain-containing protein [Staphylococcus simiae]
MSKEYASYLIATFIFTVLTIVLLPFLYFTTAIAVGAFASIVAFIFYNNHFFRQIKKTETCANK